MYVVTESGLFKSLENYNNKGLFATVPGKFRKTVGQDILNSWQAWNELTSESQFILPGEYSYQAGDMLVFPYWHLQINGNIYRRVIIYTQDKTTSPNGNPVEGILINPLESNFSETNPIAPVDYAKDNIIKNLEYNQATYINLLYATEKMVKLIEKFVPVMNQSLDYVYKNIRAQRSIILQYIDPKLIAELADICNDLVGSNEIWSTTNNKGITNITRGIPGILIEQKYFEVYSWLWEYVYRVAWGIPENPYPGVITGFDYADAGALQQKAYDWLGWNKDLLERSKSILDRVNGISFTVPTGTVTPTVTPTITPGGNNNDYPVNNDYPITTDVQETSSSKLPWIISAITIIKLLF